MKDNLIGRRKMLQVMGMAAGSLAVGLTPNLHLKAQGETDQSTPAAQQPTRHPWYELGIIGDQVMDEQLLFYLGATWSGMSDVGEVLDTGSRITPDDLAAWTREWRKTADRVRGIAEESLAAGHRISAGQAYLRASNYYRAALMHNGDPHGPEVLPLTKSSIDCFSKAVNLLSLPATFVQIPYEGTTLPAWLWRSPVAGPKAPLLIVHQGRDAWAEDNKFLADACMARGYHCLQVHCPGQGLALRLQGLTFRPDWEKVVTPIVDFAVKLPGVDADRLVLEGISMGGGLAPRAVAFEKRIKICIANPGVLNWGDQVPNYLAQISPELAASLQKVESDPGTFNAVVAKFSKAVPQLQWGVNDEMWKHGVKTPAELVIKLKQYNNEPIVDKITCQMLVIDSEAEAWSGGQAKLLYDALKGPKDYMLFTAEDAGQVHTQTAAHAVSTQRMFDWLDEHI